MNVQKVKGRMTELNLSGEKMARELEMDPSTFYRKLKNNGEGFTVKDLYGLKRALQLDDKMAIDFLLA